MKCLFRISAGIKFWDTVEDLHSGRPSSVTVRMKYVFAFQYWHCELCVENRWERGRKYCFTLLIFVLWWYLIRRWMRGSGVGQKSYLGPTEIIYFFSKDFRPSNKHDTLWLVVSTGYFYVLFSWTIAVSDFCALEIHKNRGLSLRTISFTTNSDADNHF